MVTIKEFKTRQSKTGEEFLVLVLQGGVTPIKSKESGRMYFTAKTATASCTFDEETCESLIGSQFPGEIVRVECDEYEFTIPETGEVLNLQHRWEYQDKSLDLIPDNVIEEAAVL